MSTTVTNLPRDLVEEIVSRVPLKAMRAVRLTSKTFYTLSKSQSFTKLHISKEASLDVKQFFSNKFYILFKKIKKHHQGMGVLR
ncbi:hypothetical protein ARALYDRAFT_899280 [Arabidopsis lyrata subsp. lyrata]|uniref:F-box domain-containing protein n=1 Tax=Arabidopsis lyrata subsp. lyrata TaxID=81972 RepID=D7L845_ARALL|nr:hypothetical protein ARALYDRAFT_899280 [Arabidopsis lyrata subsp. lyrata]